MEAKFKELLKYSDPIKVQRNAFERFGDEAVIYLSPRTEKKYRIRDPINNRWVDFGQMGYEDYTKHKDKHRRKLYLQRATHIKGDWKQNKYSANNLSIHLLW